MKRNSGGVTGTIPECTRGRADARHSRDIEVGEGRGSWAGRTEPGGGGLLVS